MALSNYTFSEPAKLALHIAQQIAKEYNHSTYGAAHILKALMHKDLSVLKTVERNGGDIYYMEEWAEIRLEQYPKGSKPTSDVGPDDLCEPLFHEAEHFQTELG
ncbi:MAG TPA: hypothetical protein PLS00_11070, partial [Niabella sp.]|nr:hypothetical protein [Niabella sp.]